MMPVVPVAHGLLSNDEYSRLMGISRPGFGVVCTTTRSSSIVLELRCQARPGRGSACGATTTTSCQSQQDRELNASDRAPPWDDFFQP